MKKIITFLFASGIVSATAQIDGHVYITPSFGSCNGSIMVKNCNASAWSIVLDGMPMSTGSLTFGSLCAGTHTMNFTATNGFGDIWSFSGTFNLSPSMPSAIYSSYSDPNPPLTIIYDYVSATSGCNGSASVAVMYGISPYSIQWYDASGIAYAGETGTSIDSLCATDVGVSVTDAYLPSCAGTSLGATPLCKVSIPMLNSAMATTDESCFGACDGTAVLTYMSSATVTSFSITGPSSSGSTFISSQCSGAVFSVVTDATGATLYDTTYIVGPPPISFSVDSVGAEYGAGMNGMIEYSTSAVSVQYTDGSTSGSSTSSPITGLTQGYWYLTVTDAFGCNIYDTVYVPYFTSTNEAPEITEIVLYPNPSDGIIQLVSPGDIEMFLYATNGELVFSGTLTKGDNKFSINVPNGIYWCRLVTQDRTLMFKRITICK